MRTLSRAAAATLCLLVVLLTPSRPSAQIAPITPEIEVDPTTDSGERHPVTAAAQDGTSAVVWSSGGYQVRARFFGPGGMPRTEPVVLVEQYANARPVSAAFDALDGLAVVWTGFEDRFDVGLFDVQGNLLASYRPSTGRSPMVERRPGGGYALVWADDSGTWLHRFDRTLTPVAEPVLLSEYTHGLAFFYANSEGDLTVAWGGGWTILAQRFTESGVPLTAEIEVYSDEGHWVSSIEVAGGREGFVVAWGDYVGRPTEEEDYDNVWGRLVAADGVLRSEPFLIDDYPHSVAEPSAASDREGNFVVVWEEHPDIKGRGYTKDGHPLGPPQDLDTTAEHLSEPSVALIPEGRMVTAWTSGGFYGPVRVWVRFFDTVLDVPSLEARFTWEPQQVGEGLEVVFRDESLGDDLSWTWDFDGDGAVDSTARNPIHTFVEPGPQSVTLTVSSPYGSDRHTRTVDVLPTEDLPWVTSVKREYPGFFLEGISLSNRFEVVVDWKGTPGTVAFSVNGGPEIVENGTAGGAAHSFEMSDLPPREEPSVISITPTNQEGVRGRSFEAKVHVFPYPAWLDAALKLDGSLQVMVGEGVVTWGLETQYPADPIDEEVQIPSWVPIFGGRLGVKNTFATVTGSVSSTGSGTLRVGGQTRFVSDDDSLEGKVAGSGSFRLFPPDGLELTGASTRFTLTGTFARTLAIGELPGISSLRTAPVVGGTISWLDERAVLAGELSPQIDLLASIAQKNGDLRFENGTSKIGLDLKAVLKVQAVEDRLQARGWIGGGGSATLGVPSPYLREIEAHLEAGANFELDALFEIEGDLRARYACSWKWGEGTASCFEDESETVFGLTGGAAPTVAVSPIRHRYDRFGEYASTTGSSLVSKKGSSSATPIVQNLFPGAAPEIVATAEGPLVFWVHQDPDDPIVQSTEIAWAAGGTGGWATPALVADDTRVELSPRAALDSTGRVVVSWLRIADPAFSTAIETTSDLASFYRELEVVSASFDPVAQEWSPPVPLTDDTALDTDLRLASDGAGNLLLTWLSNPDAELTSTDTSPSNLMHSTWDATTATWSPPQPVVTGLAGVSMHAADVHGLIATVVLPRDPDPTVSGDGVLEVYTRDGPAWTGPASFASGGVENRVPSFAYNSDGTGHVVWQRDGDLVHATLEVPTPVVVRPGSDTLTVYDRLLVDDADGNLALLWHEVVDDGPATLVGRFYYTAEALWSTDRPILRGEEVVHGSVDGAFDAAGRLQLALLGTAVERTEKDVAIGGGTVTFTNLPRDGQTDLLHLELQPDRDLVAEAFRVEPERPAAGDTVVASLRVRNEGQLTASGFSVDFRVGAPDSTGTLAGNVTAAEPLVAGEGVTVELPFTWPPESGDLFAVIDPLDEVLEAVETNNVAHHPASNLPPSAVVVASTTRGTAPVVVSFNGSASSDPEGGPLTYHWTFGNGADSQQGARVTRELIEPGSFPVTLVVTDMWGAVGTTTVTVTVLGTGCPFATDLQLSDQMVSSKRSFDACSSITTTGAFRVEGAGDVSLRAGNRVVLGNGFRVAQGAEVRVVIDPELRP